MGTSLQHTQATLDQVVALVQHNNLVSAPAPGLDPAQVSSVVSDVEARTQRAGEGARDLQLTDRVLGARALRAPIGPTFHRSAFVLAREGPVRR